MKHLLLFLANFFLSWSLFAQHADSLITPFELSKQQQTATYAETINWYTRLAKAYPQQLNMRTYGLTDCGRPLHLIVLAGSQVKNPAQAHRRNVLLVNNAIHPGEPEGVDASMLLARDLLRKPEMKHLLDSTVLLIIPMYNIDGALNRSCCSRANQNGPIESGFRANVKYLDLNRDFIKLDSRNAVSFTEIFQQWQPDVLLDNHTTDGADYPYSMTLIAPQRDKIAPELSPFLTQRFTPAIYRRMEKAGFETCPYMNTVAEVPDSGLVEFLETPRYSTGYAALFNTLGFVAEAHMLKPFPQRVQATYVLMQAFLEELKSSGNALRQLRQQATQAQQVQRSFPLHWVLDSTVVGKLDFKGYTASYRPSEISGQPRLYYDRTKPWAHAIKYYTHYKADAVATLPKAYIVPQAYREVLARMAVNGVQMKALTQDIDLQVEQYYVDDYQTLAKPFEGHYLHSHPRLRVVQLSRHYFAGDVVIYTNQPRNRYMAETLEPAGHDSFFAWGFFDSSLQEKEYFSAYAFEDTATRLLADDPALQKTFAEVKAADPKLAASGEAQLDWVYRHSPYHEVGENLYPVARLMQDQMLPVGNAPDYSELLRAKF